MSPSLRMAGGGSVMYMSGLPGRTEANAQNVQISLRRLVWGPRERYSEVGVAVDTSPKQGRS